MGGARPPPRNSPAFLRHFGSLARRPALRGAQARVFANPVPANISIDHKLNRCNTKPQSQTNTRADSRLRPTQRGTTSERDSEADFSTS